MTKEKTVRLTSAVCGRVARALAQAAYEAEVAVLEAEGEPIVQRLYEHVFDADVLKKVNDLPPEWVCKSYCMRIIPLDEQNFQTLGVINAYFGGYISIAHNNRNPVTGNTQYASFLKSNHTYKPVPFEGKNISVKASDKPVVEFLEWQARTEHLDAASLENGIKDATKMMLSYRTLERLKEGWPEVYPHVKAAYDAFEPAVVSNLPAVSQVRSNTILGLPCPVAGELAA